MPNSTKKSRIQRELFLRAFFTTSPPARVAAQLSRGMRELHLDRGEVLYRVGESANLLHFVVSGRIELSAPQQKAWTFGVGALIGMFDASIPRAYTRQAVASEPTELLVLEFADYLDTLEDNFGFAVDIMMLAAAAHNEQVGQLGFQRAFSRSMRGAAESSTPDAVQSSVIDRLLILRQVGLLCAAPVQALASLAQLGRVQRWSQGAKLGSPDAPLKLEIVAQGAVSLFDQHSNARVEFSTGGLLGGLAALGAGSMGLAVAKTDAMTIGLSLEDVFDVAEDHFDLYRAMLSYIAKERARAADAVAAHGEEFSRRTI